MHTKHLKKIPNKHRELKVVSAMGMFYDLGSIKVYKCCGR